MFVYVPDFCFLLMIEKKPYEKLKEQTPKHSYYRKDFHFYFHILESEEKKRAQYLVIKFWRYLGMFSTDGNALLQQGREVKVLECCTISHG